MIWRLFQEMIFTCVFLDKLKGGPCLSIYSLVVQEHEATTVGVLLGMAAAHRGTMDPAISKVISTV
jgi:hypothetical protein